MRLKQRAATVIRFVGWREWISLPELKLSRVKAKIDTGAKTSSIHAENIEYFEKGGDRWVRCIIFPNQKDRRSPVKIVAKLLGKKLVRSSSGHNTKRPVIETTLRIGSEDFPIKLNLVNRDLMGFRMLIGRDALKKRFVIDPGRSYLGSSKT